MKSKKLWLTIAMFALLLPGGLAVAVAQDAGPSGVDLGVGRGSDSHRPNILVAWRNTQRILEVEILVRNLGDKPGRGRVRMEISDEEGKTLLSTEPFQVTVPARKEGGEDGTIVQTKGFKLMNLMFDQLDRMNQRYKLRARVETEGEDNNLIDNIAAKAFNVDSRALPGAKNIYRYRFANTTDSPITATIHLDHTQVPAGWVMQADPVVGTKVTLAPKEVFVGHITVNTPKAITEGQFIDFQVSLVGNKNGRPYTIDQDEWYLVATSKPPEVDQPTVTQRPDGALAVNVAAFDPICGVKEASGVQVAYSLDDGTTFSTRVMAYTRGNFYNKTWFEAVLGPFAPGVEVHPVVTVANNAGITRRFDLTPIKISEPKPATATSARQ
jgi:hypothetical protein